MTRCRIIVPRSRRVSMMDQKHRAAITANPITISGCDMRASLSAALYDADRCSGAEPEFIRDLPRRCHGARRVEGAHVELHGAVAGIEGPDHADVLLIQSPPELL